MKKSQVAIQLYTLREHCKTAADLAVTLKKVAGIGYPAIQVSGIGPIPEEEVLAIAKGEGLVICATHEPANTILNEPERVVERLKKLGVRHTAYPHPNGVDFSDPAQVVALAAKLDRAGAVLHAAGCVLSYHNHAIEFLHHEGVTALEYIYGATSPENLQAEIDTYWVQYGGGDPVDWCARMKGRLPLLHLKDYGITDSGNHTMMEIGRGNLDFKKIIAAAEASGCEWYIVEQDTCPGDPFDSIRISFDYIMEHLVS